MNANGAKQSGKEIWIFFLFIIELSLAYISRSHWVMLNYFLISFFTHKCHFLSSSARGNWIVKAHLGEMDSKTDLITRHGLNWHRNLLTEEIFFYIHKSLVFFTAHRNTILAEKEQTLSLFTEQTKNKRQMYWPYFEVLTILKTTYHQHHGGAPTLVLCRKRANDKQKRRICMRRLNF